MTKEREIKMRLLESGATLFAEKGFKGVSIRAICEHAEASQSMIHHYFKNKQGLLDAIIDSYSQKVFLVPMKVMEPALISKDDFVARVRLIFISTFEACLSNRNVVVLVWRERMTPEALLAYLEVFKNFLLAAREKGFVRASIEPSMITGFIFDRIMNQVQLAPWLKENFGTDLENDEAYRSQWCESNTNIFLNGLINV